MGATRGQKQKSITIDELKGIVENRRHSLISFSLGKRRGNNVPKQGELCLHCNKCGNEWRTKTYVYLERKPPTNGCRKCYDSMVTNPSIYPQSPCTKRTEEKSNSSGPLRKVNRNALHQAHAEGNFKELKNRQSLRDYLKNNPNKKRRTNESSRPL